MTTYQYLRLLALACPVACSHAGFASPTVTSVTYLHPVGVTSSRGTGIGGGQQSGVFHDGITFRAGFWTSTAASKISLSPPGDQWSECYGVGDGQQVGFVTPNTIGFRRASLWSGTAASWIDLTPAGSTNSVANATRGGYQVGYASIGGADRASLWNGSVATWVNLHPVGSFDSVAHDLDATNQVGYHRIAGVFRACRWTGAAASMVDLHPAGAELSVGYGVGNGQQVGLARVALASRASLWSGTAASWINLNPAGASESVAYKTVDGWQVGYSRFSGFNHAGIWNGSAASWFDLHGSLGPAYTASGATGIKRVGSELHIIGSAINGVTGRLEAVLWVVQIAAPPVAVDDHYAMNQGASLTDAAPGVLANDSDPNPSDTLSATLVDAPAHAVSFTLNADGSFTYTPAPYFSGIDSFTYRASDGTSESNLATVQITVRQPGAGGFITGGGKFFAGGEKCSFGFVAKVTVTGVSGNLEFQNHDENLRVRATRVTWVCAPNQTDGFFSGECLVNGVAGFTFFVQVDDLGEPGRDDEFSIWVLDALGMPYHTSAGSLSAGGNIKIHS